MRFIRALSIFGLVASGPALAASTWVLPSVTFTPPPTVSTSTACVVTSGANMVMPIPAGEVVFDCTVQPVGWGGALTNVALDPRFVVVGLSGNMFHVAAASAITGTTAVTIASPGTGGTSP